MESVGPVDFEDEAPMPDLSRAEQAHVCDATLAQSIVNESFSALSPGCGTPFRNVHKWPV